MKSWENVPVISRERKAIEEAVSILKANFPVKKVILYGSKVRGTYDPHSDVDLLVITSRIMHWKEEKAASDMLFDIGLTYNVIFSPMFVSADEWENGTFSSYPICPIYKEILKDRTLVS